MCWFDLKELNKKMVTYVQTSGNGFRLKAHISGFTLSIALVFNGSQVIAKKKN